MIVPDDYNSVHDAIKNASEGQTMYVKSGVYNECLIINKKLKIIGENKENAVIQGEMQKS
ncbi:hypothetical protein DRO69_14440 [Candidatus Bathyarchaeota archaeon]|nr:MAG: hypothetical protein DRO69_14440 [Candidatus Bathyarchaeota archaeon]